MSEQLNVRVADSTRESLDNIAAALDRDRSWVVNDALRAYIDLYSWQVEHIRQGVRDGDEGRTMSTDELRIRLGNKIKAAQ